MPEVLKAAIVMVAGNHEHYGIGMDVDRGIGVMRRDAARQSRRMGRPVIVLEDETAVVDVRGTPVRVLGSTLWTDFRL
ncbi:hypothetical protein ACI01nite_18980 [Acetobacter cibinongensis]|uniref:Metallophosphoesterase n=1 Tax=Acetobacter cibinongensis TaxID=146475 RepID=A0A0D6N1G7_9PROT|nr:hypothetical protein [Acetobacter cibinongensis]GAN59774.1 hypothetical protein Abci_007_177 [Acetobacter cibinongensis]GBQ14941.1 hypothetical protein AA0482_1071 [Acetobacter cibinongensis NRIC 0482]GEL59296.1 hypothetical protein ACI01nite_18980 [Acetobacter cibinongensis]